MSNREAQAQPVSPSIAVDADPMARSNGGRFWAARADRLAAHQVGCVSPQ